MKLACMGEATTGDGSPGPVFCSVEERVLKATEPAS